MLEDYVQLGLDLFIFLIQIFILSFLFLIKARTNEKIRFPLICLIFSFFCMMGNNILVVLIANPTTIISCLKSSLVVLSSIFSLIATISFYGILKRFNDGNKIKSYRKKKKRKSR